MPVISEKRFFRTHTSGENWMLSKYSCRFWIAFIAPLVAQYAPFRRRGWPTAGLSIG